MKKEPAIFNFWLGHSLLSEIIENSLVAMDNANFHKSEKTKELVEKFSCRLLFLSPYSPDLNPIEKFWASMKAKIKKIADSYQEFKRLRQDGFPDDLKTEILELC
jgi:transposase